MFFNDLLLISSILRVSWYFKSVIDQQRIQLKSFRDLKSFSEIDTFCTSRNLSLISHLLFRALLWLQFVETSL